MNRRPLGEHGRHLPRYRTQPVPTPEPELEQPAVTYATAAGDSRKLRGIPAIARGVTGAIPNTSPGLALDRIPC